MQVSESRVSECAPVSIEIFPEDGQQRVSELCELVIIVLDPFQVLKQRLGGIMHLDGGSRGQHFMESTENMRSR